MWPEVKYKRMMDLLTTFRRTEVEELELQNLQNEHKRSTMNHETEIEIGPLSLSVDIEYEVDPGEPMIWMTRNGDGNPGIPAHPYDVSVQVIAVTGATYDLERKEIDAGWLKDLDRIASDYIDQRLEELPLEYAD